MPGWKVAKRIGKSDQYDFVAGKRQFKAASGSCAIAGSKELDLRVRTRVLHAACMNMQYIAL
jgi:hypothetical protein